MRGGAERAWVQPPSPDTWAFGRSTGNFISCHLLVDWYWLVGLNWPLEWRLHQIIPHSCFPNPLWGLENDCISGLFPSVRRQAETFPAGGQKKTCFSSPSVLPLNETGGKLTYRVIVTNIAEGEPSGALPPFSLCWFLKEKKKKAHCTCGLYRHESFPRQNEECTAAWKDPPAVHGWHGLLCCRSRRRRRCWLAFDGGSLSVMMKWKSSSAVSTRTQKVIGDRHQRTPNDMLSTPHRDRPQSLIMFAVNQTPAVVERNAILFRQGAWREGEKAVAWAEGLFFSFFF